MKPHYQDNHITIYNHDCRAMPELQDNSVQCVVTSPPYWGLRKYSGEQDLVWGGDTDCGHEFIRYEALNVGPPGSDKQASVRGSVNLTATAGFCSLCGAWRGAYGLEPAPEMYVQHTIEIFEEVKRVLRKDGVCFFNIGDSYYASGGAHKHEHANPGLSKSAQRGGVPRGGQSGKHGKELSNLKECGFFSQNPCGECAKTLLNHNPDRYDYPSLALAISDVLSNHSRKELQPARSDNLRLASLGGHSEGETSGFCSFASFLDGVAHSVEESSKPVSFQEFPQCPYALAYWSSPSLNERVLPSLLQSSDGVCPFWLYLLSHGIQGLTESISNTLEIDGASVVRIKGKAYDYSAPYPYYNTPYRLKAKDLCLIPQRLMIAFQNAGWWVRSVIIWNKPNPMPESVTDRPTESHEYILMLTKSARYYWDQEAVREIYTEPLNRWGGNDVRNTSHKWVESYEQGGDNAGIGPFGKTSMLRAGALTRANESGRNLRSVWSFPTQPYPEAHFAVFPEKLPELCIKAATSDDGCCSKCGAPWERMVKSRFIPQQDVRDPAKLKKGSKKGMDSSNNWGETPRGTNETETAGWHSTCKCNADKVPSLVLDPFAGAGTTLWVAKKLNRQAVGYDLSMEYCDLALERNRQQVMI